MECRCCLETSGPLSFPLHIDSDTPANLLAGSDTIYTLLHLPMPAVAAFHGVRRRRQHDRRARIRFRRRGRSLGCCHPRTCHAVAAGDWRAGDAEAATIAPRLSVSPSSDLGKSGLYGTITNALFRLGSGVLDDEEVDGHRFWDLSDMLHRLWKRRRLRFVLLRTTRTTTQIALRKTLGSAPFSPRLRTSR